MTLFARKPIAELMAGEGTGQSLFSSVAYGGGGLFGSLLAGVIWTTVSPRAAYVASGFIVMLAAICALVGLRRTGLDYGPVRDRS